MAEFTHVRQINVSIWGQRVGSIIPTAETGYYAFKFERNFLRSGIELAPLTMPLSSAPYVFPDSPRSTYYGLPPLFADSIPDAFGNAMIDRWMEQKGVSVSDVTALDRLAYVGRRAVGALVYEPERGYGGRPSSVDMRRLTEEAHCAINGDLRGKCGDEALREILRIGSTAGGAQAKAVVGWNRKTNEFLYGDRDLPDGFEHWIVKFTPREYPWRGEMEFAVYLKALACGIDMSESLLYELDGLKHFMTKRFDRDGNIRHHVVSLSAMANFPMTVPVDFRTYEQLFAVADSLNLDYEAKEKLFARIVFNILVGECDDHTKNFSFMLKEGGDWELAPAYDLTGSSFPSNDPWSTHGGHHQLSVNGKFSDITDADLLILADRFAIGTGPKVLNRVKETCR